MRTRQKNRVASTEKVTFEGACALIETALRGTVRQEIVAAVSRSENLGRALLRLRESMRTNVALLRQNARVASQVAHELINMV